MASKIHVPTGPCGKYSILGDDSTINIKVDTGSPEDNTCGLKNYKIGAYSGHKVIETAPQYGTTKSSTLFTVALWFASNIGIIMMNKYILDRFGFRYPVFLTGCHMLACTIIPQIGHHGSWPRYTRAHSCWHFSKIAVLAATFLASVVLNNVALQYIPVSFAEEIGALTPAVTAFLAFAFLGKVEKCTTYGALIPIMFGIILATGFELSFHWMGFLGAVGGCIARAFKTVLQEFLLNSDNKRIDSMSLLSIMAPIAVLLLLPAIALLEPGALSVALRLSYMQPTFAAILLSNSVLAYIVNLSNFHVTKCTCALTLQVLGCSKGLLATVISVMLFGNRISAFGAAGYGITVSGILAYTWCKYKA